MGRHCTQKTQTKMSTRSSILLTVSVLLVMIVGHPAAAKFNGHDKPDTGEPGGPIVHLMDWRYDDIAYECQTVLRDKGYGGVQVSPVTEYLLVRNQMLEPFARFFGIRPWYSRHQVVSYQINNPSGNEDEFIAMVHTCNSAGIKVYVDVVLNHMTVGYRKDNVGCAGSVVDSMKFDYPAVPYTKDDFHQPPCNVDEKNATKMRNCEVRGMHDLNQTNPCVRQKMRVFLNKLISFGVAGFRVGHAKYMWPKELKSILGDLDYLNCDQGFTCESSPYIYQDFFDTDVTSTNKAVRPSEYLPIGRVTDHRYAVKVYNIFNRVKSEKPVNFANIKEAWNLLDSDKSVVFVNTYETQEEASNVIKSSYTKHYKLAAALLLASPHGQPLITSTYTGYHSNGDPRYNKKDGNYVATNQQSKCASGWTCEHRYDYVLGMLGFRQHVGDAPVTNWWHDGNYAFGFSRGDKGFILINNNAKKLQNQRIKTGLPSGTYCDVITGELTTQRKCSGNVIKVDAEGYVQVDELKSSDNSEGVLAIHTGAME